MTIRRLKSEAAVTLVEIMLTTVILLVAVIGAAGYRYYAAMDTRKATKQIAAARIGLLLCENWRGFKGDENYDPTTYLASELAITEITVLDELVYADFNLLGGYEVASNGVNYYPILMWKDVATGFRALNVVVAWRQTGQEATSIADVDKLFQLTTYTIN